MKLRILLVDDHDDVRASLAQRLRRHPRLELVAAAASPEEATDVLRKSPVDIILMDVHGQGGRGLDACRALSALSEAAVILFASFTTPELLAAARGAGAAGVLLKHIDSDRLIGEMILLAARPSDAAGGRTPERAGDQAPAATENEWTQRGAASN